MPAVSRSIHVVTYAQFPGQDAPDVLAHGVLKTAANPKDKVEGDATKALISKTQNHQCNGDPTTGGCTVCHAYAEERVVSRLVDGGDSIAVVWRKYHPLAAKGQATPGAPFEAEHDGVKIRVEAREVVEGDAQVLTPKTVSWLALQGLEAELKQKSEKAKIRETAREAVDAFEAGPFAAVVTKLEDLRAAVKDLPDFPNEPTRAEVVKTARDAIMALSQQVGDAERGVLNAEAPTAADVQRLQQLIAQVTPQLEAPLAPLVALRAKNADWVAMQDELRRGIDALGAITERAAAERERLGGLDVRALGHVAQAKPLETLLGHSRDAARLPDAVRVMAELAGDAALAEQPWKKAWTAAKPKIDAAVAATVTAFDGLVAAEEAKLTAFTARAARIAGLKVAGGPDEQHLVRQLEAGAMVAGFASRFFVGQLRERLGAVRAGLGSPEGLSYHTAADQKKLAALESTLAPVFAVLDRASADLAKRAVGLFPQVKVGALAFTPPSASAQVTAVHGDKVDLRVHLRANGPEPLLVGLKNAEGQLVQQLALRERGHRLSVTLKGVAPSLSVVVLAAGPAAQAKLGETRALSRVDVPAFPLELARVVDNERHVLPTTYTPAPQQPGGQQNVTFAVPDGAQSAIDAIPGEKIR